MNKNDWSFSLKVGREIEIEYFSGSGGGGQHRNKHKNCVRLRHRASGAQVQATEQRSRVQNQKNALKRLVEDEKFKRWIRIESSIRAEGYKNIEQKIEEATTSDKLLIEIYKDNRWQNADTRGNNR